MRTAKLPLKQIISALIVVSLLFSIAIIASAADTKSENSAQALYDLGLFKGVGDDESGNPIFALDENATRAQGIVMLLRLLGVEEKALSQSWSIPFSDVPEWAAPYVGYAYANNISKGISDTEFGTETPITAAQYLTFVLRALGYVDGVDFNWDTAWTKTDEIGITNGEYNSNNNNLLRSNIANISYAALTATNKTTGKALIDELVELGAVSETAAAEFVENSTAEPSPEPSAEPSPEPSKQPDTSGSSNLPPELPMTRSYNFIFNYNGSGTPEGMPESQILISGAPASEPTVNPTLYLHTFNGWYVDTAYTQKYDFSTKTFQDTVVYARFDILPQYNVSFEYLYEDFQDNDVKPTAPSSVLVFKGLTVEAPEVEFEGYYIFDGKWYTDETLTTEFDFNTPVNADITLYANCGILPKYEITFLYTYDNFAEEDDLPAVPEKQYVYEGFVAAIPELPDECYGIDGWYVTEDRDPAGKFSFNTAIENDVTLYAKCRKLPLFTVTFALPAGSVYEIELPEPIQVYEGQTLTRPDDPVREGYEFVEWYMVYVIPGYGNYNIQWSFAGSATPSPVMSDVTLYPKYVQPYEANVEELVVLSLTYMPATQGYDMPHKVARAIVGDYIYPATGVDGLPILASAFTTDPYITYQTGLYRIKTNDAGYVTEFYTDLENVDEGYRTGVASDGRISLGVDGREYTYDENTALFNLTLFTDATLMYADNAAAIEAVFNTERITYHYWAVTDEGNHLTALYYRTGDSTITAAKYENIQKFEAVVPQNAIYSANNPQAELKYAFYDPKTDDRDTTDGVPLVVWFHGSGFGNNVWDIFFKDSDASPDYIAKWASDEYQNAFGDGGAYILCPTANVQPPLGGLPHRWGDAGADHVTMAYNLIMSFIADNPDIDIDRIYVGGFSVGGGMTMLMIQEYTELFAAAFPCSPTARTLYGSGNPASPDTVIADKLIDLPIWFFHSDSEGLDTVRADLSASFVEYLLDNSTADFRYTEFDDGVPTTDIYGNTTMRFTLPNGISTTGGHGIAWAAVLNNLLYDSGTSYWDTDNTSFAQEGIPPVGTFFDWLAAQTKAVIEDIETEEPDVEEPDTEEPDVEEPDIEEPDTEEPDIEEPDTEEPDTEEPDTEEPDIEEPDTEEPDTEEPDIEEPDTEEPDIEEPDTEEPDFEEPDTEEPDIEEPNTEEPDTDVPDTEEPGTDAPDTEEPGAVDPDPVDDDDVSDEVAA